MTMKDLVKQLSVVTQQPMTVIESIVNSLFQDVLPEMLKKENSRFTFSKFGTFYNMPLKARQGMNPNTGKKISIPEKKVIRFRAAIKVIQNLNPHLKKNTTQKKGIFEKMGFGKK